MATRSVSRAAKAQSPSREAMEIATRVNALPATAQKELARTAAKAQSRSLLLDALTSEDDLYLTLTEAHGLIDTLYTAAGNRTVEELCERTLATTLHVAMQKLEHALKVLESRQEARS